MDSRSDLNYLGSVCNPRSSRILTETRVVFRQAGLPVQDAGLGPTYYHYLASVFFCSGGMSLPNQKMNLEA